MLVMATVTLNVTTKCAILMAEIVHVHPVVPLLQSLMALVTQPAIQSFAILMV